MPLCTKESNAGLEINLKKTGAQVLGKTVEINKKRNATRNVQKINL